LRIAGEQERKTRDEHNLILHKSARLPKQLGNIEDSKNINLTRD
jgi:hypothetical protein